MYRWGSKPPSREKRGTVLHLGGDREPTFGGTIRERYGGSTSKEKGKGGEREEGCYYAVVGKKKQRALKVKSNPPSFHTESVHPDKGGVMVALKGNLPSQGTQQSQDTAPEKNLLYQSL